MARVYGLGSMVKTVVATALFTSFAWAGAGAYWWSTREPVLRTDNAWADTAPAAAAGGGAAQSTDLLRHEPAQLPPGPGNVPPPVVGTTLSGLLIPVQGIASAQLVDTYTQSRDGDRPHNAIDIIAPRGTPVLAAAPGLVEKLFLSKAGGQTIYIRSADKRTIYYYAHLDSYAPGLAEGRQVPRGAVLGTVGSTGNASPQAPHLHFAVLQADPALPWHQPARAFNPYPLLKAAP